MENGKLTGLLAFVAGVAIGVNWPKIKKFIPGAKDKVIEFTETAKEKVTDSVKKLFNKTPAVAVKAGRRAAA